MASFTFPSGINPAHRTDRPGTLHPLTAEGMTSPHSAAGAGSRHDRLVDQTQKWVAQTFFGTLLKQMRKSPFKSDIFDGGRGGQVFSSLYDQQLADRMSRAAGGKIVRSIVRQIEGRQAYQKQHLSAEPAPRPRHKTGNNPFENVRIHVPATLRA